MGTDHAPPPTLNDAALKAKLQELRQTDNVTNLGYLLATYLFLAAVIGGAIAFDLYRSAQGWSWAWDVPVVLAAVVLIGAGQHMLSGLAHEGSHHTLLRDRTANDLVTDWFCMFPLFSSVYHYRLQHLAHHQFVNDPDRDPDVSQLQTSGHWLDFPVEKAAFVRTLLKQLWPPNLIRFMRVRARYNATGTDKNPYLKKGVTPSKVAVRVGLVYVLTLLATLTGLTYAGNAVALCLVPVALWAAFAAVFARLPLAYYHQSRVHPVVSPRTMTILRTLHMTILFTTIAVLTHLTGRWWSVYFVLLWVVPLFTSFAFFMILRQLVQHGNGGRGWLTNTRVFLVDRLLRQAVFPFGQDYHLPHHMYATVPHYRLRQLHEFLMRYPEYREQAVVVEGYFQPPRTPAERPTVVDVLGPAYAGGARDVYIDETILEGDRFEDVAEIRRDCEVSRAARV